MLFVFKELIQAHILILDRLECRMIIEKYIMVQHWLYKLLIMVLRLFLLIVLDMENEEKIDIY